MWPCDEKSVSSGYFSREIDYNGGDPGGPVTSDQHLGIDIAADPTTTKVLAPCDGDIILVNRLYNSLVVLFKITGQSQ